MKNINITLFAFENSENLATTFIEWHTSSKRTLVVIERFYWMHVRDGWLPCITVWLFCDDSKCIKRIKKQKKAISQVLFKTFARLTVQLHASGTNRSEPYRRIHDLKQETQLYKTNGTWSTDIRIQTWQKATLLLIQNYIKQKNFEAYIRARNKRSTVNKLSSLRYEP